MLACCKTGSCRADEHDENLQNFHWIWHWLWVEVCSGGAGGGGEQQAIFLALKSDFDFFLHTNYTLSRWREDESDLMLSENKSSDEMPLSNIAFLCLPFSPVCKLQSTVMGAEPPEWWWWSKIQKKKDEEDEKLSILHRWIGLMMRRLTPFCREPQNCSVCALLLFSCSLLAEYICFEEA